MSLLTEVEYKLTEFAAATLIYFEKHKLIEIAKKILVECALIRPLDPQTWIGKHIKRIANEIYQDCLNQGKKKIMKSLHLSGNFLYRVVIFGRPGSGRKAQANYLVANFNLVLIDVEMLIYHCLRGNDERPHDSLDRELQKAFYYNNCLAKSKALLNIIGRRVLEKDCLQRGWVLLNFPHTLQDFKDTFETFKIPPNKMVYLKCSKKTCMLRLANAPNLCKPSHNCTNFEHEMHFFDQNKKEIIEYLLKRHETIFVNAEQTSENLKTELLSSIIKSPYVMGFKQTARD